MKQILLLRNVSLSAVLIIFIGLGNIFSQDCKYSCQDLVYVSFDENCQYQVTINDVLKDTTGCTGAVVELYDHYGVLIPNLLTGDYRGQKITYKVVGTDDNSCWGYLTPEDKWAAIIDCRDDTLNCWDAEEFIDAMPTTDNCGYGLEFNELHRIWVDYHCDSVDFVGYVQRTVVSTDVWGNSSRCDSQRIYVIREYLDSLVCPQDTFFECCINDGDFPFNTCYLWDPEYVYEDAEGYSHPIPKPGGLVEPPYISTPDGDKHYVGDYTNSEGGSNNGKCNIVADYKDHIIPTCGPTYKIRREWKIFDWCTGEDTFCIQWIKIIDSEPPVVFFGPEFTPFIVANTQPHECVAHVELGWPHIYADCAIKAAKGDHEKAFKDFKVRYEMEWYDQDHPGKVIVRSGEIPYGEKVIEYVPKSGLLFIQPEVKVKYYVTDGCWNESRVCQSILVFDNEPPTPVCDEITQVTLDPDSCWTRIYAEDLDDGSHDNCDEVHFAIAKMSDIEYWRSYWHDELHECYYEYGFASHEIDMVIEEWIDLYVFESYIDLEECGRDSLVLRVYEDLNTPPYDPHIFRGSEHDWYNWFRAPILRTASFRCNYVFYYDSIGKYHDPIYPELTCRDVEIALGLDAIGDRIAELLEILNSFDYDFLGPILQVPDGSVYTANEIIELLLGASCENPFVDSDGESILEEISCFEISSLLDGISLNDPTGIDTSATRVVEILLLLLNDFNFITAPMLDGLNPSLLESNLTAFTPITTAQSFSGPLSIGEFINILYYLICYGDDIDMKIKVYENLANNPELLAFVIQERNLVQLAYSGIWRKRFLDLPYYNDCMIEVIKDDKTPPVCEAPDHAYYYCDGVPVEGFIYPNGGNDKFCWESARFAHDICLESDVWLAGCKWDDPSDGGNDNCQLIERGYCVDAPWDGGDHGYYGGPAGDSYYYDDPCDEDLSAWYPEENYSWKPIYCRFWLMLDKYDTEGEGKPNPYDYFGEPTYYDNCWDPEIEYEDYGELDECGVGILTRTWTVTDKCGNTSSCYQTITIKARSDFEVKFPADIEVYCDELNGLAPIEDDPDTYPVVTDDDCELIGITYNDQVIDTEQDGCFKILRTWKVIDWCVYVPDIHGRYPDVIVDDRCVADPDNRPCVIRNLKDDGDGFMTYLQVIKVIDDVAPEVVCNPDSLFCIYDDECDDLYVEYDLGSATDNCTEELLYRYAINPNGDSEESDWIYGHGYTVQNLLPVGVHTVILYAKDDCGNEGYCELTIEIRDCKPPTPYCYDGIATVVMPSTNEIAVWARDLDAGSFDNCTDPDMLRFTFTDTPPEEDSTYVEDDRSSYNIYTCDDLGQVQVSVYVWDETGNVDFCQVALLIQPGSEACPGVQISNTVEETKMGKDVMNGQKKVLTNSSFNTNGLQVDVSGSTVLRQNRPNPFNQNTIISFELPETTFATVRVLDVTGKELTRIEGQYNRGYHEWKLDRKDLGLQSGILYYQLRTDGFVATKKMVLIE